MSRAEKQAAVNGKVEEISQKLVGRYREKLVFCLDKGLDKLRRPLLDICNEELVEFVAYLKSSKPQEAKLVDRALVSVRSALYQCLQNAFAEVKAAQFWVSVTKSDVPPSSSVNEWNVGTPAELFAAIPRGAIRKVSVGQLGSSTQSITLDERSVFGFVSKVREIREANDAPPICVELRVKVEKSEVAKTVSELIASCAKVV